MIEWYILDSVIVTSGNASDTTGADGVYTLWNLDVGINTVQVRRPGFYTTNADVEVLCRQIQQYKTLK